MMWAALWACQGTVAAPEHRGGVALGLFADDPRYDYSGLLEEITATGATDVLIAVPWSLPSHLDHALQASTPADTLPTVLREAARQGLRTTVMPIVVLTDRSDGVWRGDVEPTERASFWTNYRTLLRRVAIDSERAGAHRLVIGSELNALETDPSWTGVVDEARRSFSGRLSYSANWDHYAQVPFWAQLDEIAVTAYFPVDAGATWSSELAVLQGFARDRRRPLVISEYGYPALDTAAARPWDETTGAAYAPELQDRLLGDALTALQCQPPAAHFLWNWFGTGSPDEASFTPRGRPAEATVARAFTRPSCPESLR